MLLNSLVFFFFFNDTATTEIYTLSLHDALPIGFGRWRIHVAPRSVFPPHTRALPRHLHLPRWGRLQSRAGRSERLAARLEARCAQVRSRVLPGDRAGAASHRSGPARARPAHRPLGTGRPDRLLAASAGRAPAPRARHR